MPQAHQSARSRSQAAAGGQASVSQRHRGGVAMLRQGRRSSAQGTKAAAAAAPPASLPELPPVDDGFESRHAFAPQANWLVPGHLMVGRYPFIEPHAQSRTEGEELLARILRSGINVFVSLNAELPPQAEMPARGKDGFLPYKATADLLAASMNGVPPAEVVEGLRNPQLDKYIPERRRAASESYQSWQPLVPQYMHLPITDLQTPSKEELQRWVNDLAQRLQNSAPTVLAQCCDKIYMHCWGGRGRSGTIGACVLAKLYGLSADEALRRVQRGYDCRNFDDAKAPETEEQKQLVRDFVSGL